MKKVTLFLVALALCLTAKAGELTFPKAPSLVVVFTNITFASNITASVTFTNAQNTIVSSTHTFQLYYTPVGTNSATFYLDDTIDGSNWNPVSTNTTTGAATLDYELDIQGKWSQYRWRGVVAATNATATGLYMAQ
jgi:hypothetical protein